MAHVGVPKRDPCQKCQLPVFLAERLIVGKKVYHRTCLKCARCGSQLTPGSFYETEVDDEYCCETCPDEEEIASNELNEASSSVMLRHSTSFEDEHQSAGATAAAAIHTKPTTVRSSIADRLAFFEKSKNDSGDKSSSGDAKSNKLLQKSVSDEEKSKSLKRMEATAATAATTSAYKMNSALSSFLNDTIDGAENDEEENSAATATDSNKTDTQMETSDTDEDDETEDDLSLEHKQPTASTLPAPPELPTTQPPMPAAAVDMRKTDDTAAVDSPSASRHRFTATAQLQLVTAPVATHNEEDVAEAETKLKSEAASQQQTTEPEDIISKSDRRMKTEIQFDVTTTASPTTATTTIDNTNNNHQQYETIAIESVQTSTPTTTHNNKLTQIKSLEEINLDLSQINDNDSCVTKDKIADTKKADTDITAATQNTNSTSTTTTESNPIKQIKTELQKLETESSTDMDIEQESEPKPTVELRVKSAAEHSVADEATTERLSVVRARLQQFEVIANKDNNNTKCPEDNVNNISNSNIDSLSENEKNIVNTNPAIATVVNAKMHEPETVEPKSMPQENLINEETKLNEMEIDIDSTESKKLNESLNEVPSDEFNKIKDISNIEIKPEIVIGKVKDTNEQKIVEKEKNIEEKQQSPIKTPQKQVIAAAIIPTTITTSYPEDLNPFASDDEQEPENKENIQKRVTPQPRTHISATSRISATPADSSLNPFDSSDDEIELEKSHNSTAASTPSSTSATGFGGKVPPPRPPPPRISRNPFGDGADTDEDANSFSRRSSLSSSLTKKTPVPTPRSNVSLSQNPTPEPTPRLSTKTPQSATQQPLQNSNDYYGSANSLGTTLNTSNGTPQSLQRNNDIRGSNNSLTSSAGGTIRSRKNRRAPAPPAPAPVKELFPSTETIGSSKASTPSSSTVGTPKSGRKKRHAPAPPKPARLDPTLLPQLTLEEHLENGTTASKNSLSYPLQSELDSKLSDEEKALLEGKQLQEQIMSSSMNSSRRRLIPLDASLLEDNDLHGDHIRGEGDGTCTSDDVKQQQQHHQYHQHGGGAGDGEEYEPNVVYRRMLIPPKLDTPTHESNPLLDELNAAAQHDRQLEKLKDNKEAQNRNRQSQISAASSGNEDGDPAAGLYNKSSHGKWKRRKGPAPALPIPQRKILQMLPLQEIRHELEIIEVQQQGLEKQGVILEKMIRDRCEGENGEPLGVITTVLSEDVSDGSKTTIIPETVQNSKEVEDLILQLFELVNEKNELFRRQAELMYLRRQHRLEQEQADLEYEIRVLMAQPERNKTDTDKAREEALIARLVDVVQLRNEVVDCLEMDRLREAEEDMSIKQRLEMHTAQRDGGGEDIKKTSAKLSKKEKKKQKEAKKLSKSKKNDADKDADETELNMDKQKLKKKKKKFLF